VEEEGRREVEVEVEMKEKRLPLQKSFSPGDVVLAQWKLDNDGEKKWLKAGVRALNDDGTYDLALDSFDGEERGTRNTKVNMPTVSIKPYEAVLGNWVRRALREGQSEVYSQRDGHHTRRGHTRSPGSRG
jgi:hypothetical protein